MNDAIRAVAVDIDMDEGPRGEKLRCKHTDSRRVDVADRGRKNDVSIGLNGSLTLGSNGMLRQVAHNVHVKQIGRTVESFIGGCVVC